LTAGGTTEARGTRYSDRLANAVRSACIASGHVLNTIDSSRLALRL
jgi:hypothetical protein